MSDEGWLRVNATTMILDQVDRIYIGVESIWWNIRDKKSVLFKTNFYPLNTLKTGFLTYHTV